MDQTTEVFTQCMGFETITVDNTAGGKSLSASKYRVLGGTYNGTLNTAKDARVALITLEGTAGTNDIRWTCDGTAPVATTTGHLLKAGQNLTIKGLGNIVKLRMIREGATSGTVSVSYFE